MKLLEILLLIIPAIFWKLWKDRNGTVHPNYDLLKAWWIMLGFILVDRFIFHHYQHIATNYDALIFVSKHALVSITGYALIFPYAFNWYWYSKNRVFVMDKIDIFKFKLHYTLRQLSPTAIPDQWFLKYNIHWAVRLAIYIALFVGSLIWFFT